MTQPISDLTDAQRATLRPFLRELVRGQVSTEALTADDRDRIVAGIGGCYAAAGLSCPSTVVWVSSPRTGSQVATFAATRLSWMREPPAEPAVTAVAAPGEPAGGAAPRGGSRERPRHARSLLVDMVGTGVTGAVLAAGVGSVVGATVGGVGAYIHAGGTAAIIGTVTAVALVLWGCWTAEAAVGGYKFVGALVASGLVVFFGAAVGAHIGGATHVGWGDDALSGALWWGGVAGAVGFVGGLVAAVAVPRNRRPVPAAPAAPTVRQEPAVTDPTSAQIRRAVIGALDQAVRDAVTAQVRADLRAAVEVPGEAAVRELRAAAADVKNEPYGEDYPGQQYGGVPLDTEVDRAVPAIVAAVCGPVGGSAPVPPWTYARQVVAPVTDQFGGAEVAVARWLSERGGVDLGPAARDALRAYADASRAGCWWAHRDFVVISERAVELCVESLSDDETGPLRPHRDDGPAMCWPDELEIWYSHGQRVPVPGHLPCYAFTGI